MTIKELADQLDAIEERKHKERGYAFPHHKIRIIPGRVYTAIDVGNSSAWLIDNATGEIFNTVGYHKADKKKKKKANIGNLETVDPENMHARRWNYLR